MNRMNRHPVFAAACLQIAALPALAAAPPGDPRSAESDHLRQEFIPHEILVELRPGSRPAQLSAQIPGLEIRSTTSQFGVARLVPPGAMLYRREEARAATLRLLERVLQRPEVRHAQLNHLFQLAAPPAWVPNDPLFAQQWHYLPIFMAEAWALTGGGGNVKIAILDTGRSEDGPHPDLDGRWSLLEYNANDPSSPPIDRRTWRHGTHVAGIAGAATNNATGGAGVCFNCTLMNVKVTAANSGDIATDKMLDGLRWAVANGARVINMSFAYPAACTDTGMAVVRSQIDKAVAQGVVVVASAGNHAGSVDNATPASCPGVISVAASDQGHQLASYSNGGTNVAITAPGGGGVIAYLPNGGVDPNSSVYGNRVGTPLCPADVPNNHFNPYTFGVVSTWTTRRTLGTGSYQNTHCYRYLSGTSMSAPHVSGAVGLMLSANPFLSPAQVRSILRSTATPMPGCGGRCGPGLLNVHLAIVEACSRNSLCPY